MNNQEYVAMVEEELGRLRADDARAWVRRATSEMIEEFQTCHGLFYSPEMREAIQRELDRATTHES